VTENTKSAEVYGAWFKYWQIAGSEFNAIVGYNGADVAFPVKSV
jgi:hypothetical protein